MAWRKIRPLILFMKTLLILIVSIDIVIIKFFYRFDWISDNLINLFEESFDDSLGSIKSLLILCLGFHFDQLSANLLEIG